MEAGASAPIYTIDMQTHIFFKKQQLIAVVFDGAKLLHHLLNSVASS
jgi:hypothetical protein